MHTIQEGQQAGALRDEPTMDLALAARSLVHGLASLLVDRQLEQGLALAGGVEAIARSQTRLLFSGLAREVRD